MLISGRLDVDALVVAGIYPYTDVHECRWASLHDSLRASSAAQFRRPPLCGEFSTCSAAYIGLR